MGGLLVICISGIIRLLTFLNQYLDNNTIKNAADNTIIVNGDIVFRLYKVMKLKLHLIFKTTAITSDITLIAI